MMMILMSLPPSRFSPKPLLKRQRWVDKLLSLSLSLSLSLFVVVVVDTNRLEEKDAAPALSKRVVSRSFVRAKERAIIAFCVADVTNNTSFFWGRKVVVATKSFFFLFFFFLVEFPIRFFFHVIFRVSNGFFFFSHSLGKKRISVLYEEALLTTRFCKRDGTRA